LKKRTTALGTDVQLSEKKSLSVYARVEKKTTKESRSLTIQRRGRSWSNASTTTTTTSGAPRGRTRASTRAPTSTPRCRCPPQVAASKETRRRSEINKPRFVRARTTTSAAKQQRTRRTLPAIACFYAPMFGVLRDPEKDGGKTGPARTRT